MPEPELPTGRPEQAKPESRPSSALTPLLAMFLILCLVGYNGKDSWWGVVAHVPMLAFLAFAIWASLSRKQFEQSLKSDPGQTRNLYRAHSLFFFVLIPGSLWLAAGLPSLHHWLNRFW